MRTPAFIAFFLSAAAATLASSHAAAAPQAQSDPTVERIPMARALVIDGVGGGGRNAVAMDALQGQIVAGTWTTPKAGDAITLADGSTRTWSEVEANADGALPADRTRGGYALWTIESPEDRIMLLNATGHGMAYVNGECRAGDPYGNGIVSLPVKLRKGVNEILLHCPRGAVRAGLVEPRAKVMLSKADMTLPDLEREARDEAWAAAVVINAGEEVVSGLGIDASFDDLAARTMLDPIPPLSVRKVGFRVPRLRHGVDPGVSPKAVRAHLLVPAADTIDRSESIQFDVAIAEPHALQKRTFVSEIDGSVQYFAVRPALKDAPDNGLILTLHGADVEASGQAAAYQSKDWAHIVAPTNRRKYGFDWEDWGRLDGLEALRIAKSQLAHDPRRVYLTGHSMGGHGTWQIGVTYPDLFAAIAPSAGWISFETYAGGAGSRASQRDGKDITPLQRIMRRAGNAGRTLDLQRNLDGLGVYVLHGEADDNVPVQQARAMKEQLSPWHTDFAYHEQPGAGHWWGNECVDWPPLMEFLRAHARPEPGATDHVSFITASPGVSAQHDWVTIQQQQQSMAFSRVDVQRDLANRTVSGTTENVARLALDVGAFEGEEELVLELDGQVVRAGASPQGGEVIELVRSRGEWESAEGSLAPSHKTPARCGPFKAAFNHRFMFVYGTNGTAQENAWAFNKVRFDAETFWYRGNGSIDVVADIDFDAHAADGSDRSVIVYGNADTNLAWGALLGESPVQARRGSIVIGGREFKGESLACLFVRPRTGSDVACVGVVSGTGLIGARLSDRLPYFLSGVAYPDCIVLDAGDAAHGAIGIRAAGFFGNDWSVEAGDFAWSE